jgi:hypothetical protein
VKVFALLITGILVIYKLFEFNSMNTITAQQAIQENQEPVIKNQ